MKRFAVLLMCICIVLSMIACGEKPATTEDDQTQVPNVSENEKESNADSTGMELPIVEPGTVELTYMGNDVWCPNKSFKDGLPVQEEIEKRTGVKINYEVYSSDLELVLQTRLAAGVDLPDLCEIPPFDSNIGIQRYASNGVLIPLTELIEQNAPDITKLHETYPNLKAVSTSPDGEIYGIAGFWGDINEVVPDWTMIRADWLKKLELEMPNTPDELYNVLKAFYEKDPNGNNEKDEVPMVTLNLLATKYLMTGFGFPTNTDWWNEDGKTVYYPVDSRYKDFLSYLNKLYSENLLSSDIEGSQRMQIISQDRAGAYCHDPSDTLAGYDTLAKAVDPECDYQFIPVIKLDENAPDPQMAKRNYIWHYYGITKDCKDPEVAMKWINYVYANEEGKMLYDYGIEGLTYELDDAGEPQFTDFVTNNPDYDSPFLALRSIGAWPCYFINDSADAFMKIFEGTKVEEIGKQYQGKMIEPFPEMLGTPEESEVYMDIWPDLKTYLDESYIKFVTGAEPIENFDKYVETAYSMGLDKIIEIKDAQFKRYSEMAK